MSAVWNEVTFNMYRGTILYLSPSSIKIILSHVYQLLHNIQIIWINLDEPHNNPKIYIEQYYNSQIQMWILVVKIIKKFPMPHNQEALRSVLEHTSISARCRSRISNNLLWLISNTSSLREIKINCHDIAILIVRICRRYESTLLGKYMDVGKRNHLFKMLANNYILTKLSKCLHGKNLSKIVIQLS